jgi:hypothetical protein
VHPDLTTATIDTVAFSKAQYKWASDAKWQVSIDAANCSAKKKKKGKLASQKLKAKTEAAWTAAFIKKVAVESRITEMNEHVLQLDLLNTSPT